MKLDATDLRYVSADEFRVLTATEMGSKNHEVVPSSLIAQLSGLRGGQINKLCGQLAKRNLIARVVNARYDGYRLTYGGLDYLALRTFSRRNPPSVAAVGQRIGVGKESDIMIVTDEHGEKRILKMHRLGRISFRAIKSKRDYLRKGQSASWMYMSRLSAQKEFAFLKVLYHHDFPVPIPIDQARHCIVMSLVDSLPLRSVDTVDDVADLYSKLMELIVRLGRAGLIHGDFNEFNILIKKDGEPVVIDFPQMVSTRHENAEYFFNRDVNCIRKFFRKRFRFEGESWPVWSDILDDDEDDDEAEADAEGEALGSGEKAAVAEGEVGASAGATESSTAVTKVTLKKRLRLDLEVEASGFGRALQRELEDYMIQVQDMPPSDGEDEDAEEKGEEEQEDEEDIEEEEEDKEEGEGSGKPDDPLDEEAEAARIAARLEAIRLHKALGNDGNPDDEEDDQEEDEEEEEEEDEDEDEDGDEGSDISAGPAPSDYTQYSRAAHRPPSARRLLPQRKLGDIDELRSVVSSQMGKEKERTQSKHHARKAVGGVGKSKGQKWKASPSHLVSKGGGW